MLPDRRSLGDPISEIFFGEERDRSLRSLVEGVLGASPCADDDGRLLAPDVLRPALSESSERLFSVRGPLDDDLLVGPFDDVLPPAPFDLDR